MRKLLIAAALVGVVAAIGTGTASASSSSYYPTLSSYSYTSPFSAGYFNTPSTAYGLGATYTSPSYYGSYHLPSLSSYRLPSLSTYSGYGAISSTTGLLRTHYVHGYYRANGTYVSPYFRSCSYCR